MSYCDKCAKSEAEVSRLSAALATAEDRLLYLENWKTEAEARLIDTAKAAVILHDRLEAAERERDEARANALEEAAKICDDSALVGDHPRSPSDWCRASRSCAKYIRALAQLTEKTT